jgi:hypothetical protein
MEAARGGFRGMVGSGRPAAGEVEEGGVVRRRGSAAGHGWWWPAVRRVPAAGEMQELGAAAGELEEYCGGGRARGRREVAAVAI